MDQNAGIKSAAFKRSIQKKKEKERHFLNEVSYGWTLGFRSSGPATTTLFGLTNRFTCMWNSFQSSTPEIYTFTREWIENDLIPTETESIKCGANTIKKKTQKHWEVILFSHQVMSYSSVTPWTIGHQAPVSMILQARILKRVAISFSRGSSAEPTSPALAGRFSTTESPGNDGRIKWGLLFWGGWISKWRVTLGY